MVFHKQGIDVGTNEKQVQWSEPEGDTVSAAAVLEPGSASTRVYLYTINRSLISSLGSWFSLIEFNWINFCRFISIKTSLNWLPHKDSLADKGLFNG